MPHRRRTIGRKERPMRMIFRCDPKLADHLPRPFPARSALPDV